MATKSSEKPLTLRERKKRDAMARLLEAAKDLMWEKGYDDVTTKEIAAHADIGEATIFRYVPSKLDLFLLVYGAEFEKVIASCEAAEEKLLSGDPPTDPESYLKRLFDRYSALSELYVQYPELGYTYVKESFGSRTDIGRTGLAHGDRWYGILEAILKQGQEAGAFIAIDASAVVQNCHALYVHEVLRSHARGLPAAEMPQRLLHRLDVLLQPLKNTR